MPAKYHIHTEPAPPRVRPPGKLGIVEWREDCASCHNCVKDGCVYGFYRDESDTLRDDIGYLDYIYQCKGCLTCVQNCTKGILTRVVNPEYERLGDAYYHPEIILSTWYQAETGRIPVSGSGYGGRFCGPGFDAMWTDMSEIVRPTRDGIHGREYISTSVDIGGRLRNLAFRDGKLAVTPPPILESPLPLIFELVPDRWNRGPIPAAITRAAAELGVMAVMPAGAAGTEQKNVIPLLLNGEAAARDGFAARAPLVMLPDGQDVLRIRASLKERNANQIVAVRVPATPRAPERVVALAREGIEVVHLLFDPHGREYEAEHPRHARYGIRDVHGALVKEGIRDVVTVIASGGIALPEHMAKAIICGADLVAVDHPLMIAMECRLCGECDRGQPCPVDLDRITEEYAVRRVVNLMGAWRNQLLELLGAMGIREVRRLRGETGRAMFFEDLERQTFGKIFGKRKDRKGTELP